MNLIGNKNLKKRSLLLFVITMIFSNIFSQDLDSIKVLWHNNDLARARELIDQYVVNNNSGVEGWLTRACIYNNIAKHPTYQGLFSDGRSEALTSIKKALSIAPSHREARALLQQIGN